MPKFPFGLKKDDKSNASVPDFFDQVEQWKNTDNEEALNEPSEPQPAPAQPQQAPAPQTPQPAPQQAVKPAQTPQPVQAYNQPASQPTNIGPMPTARPAPQPVQPVQPIQPAQPVPSQYVAPQPMQTYNQPIQQQAIGETAVDQLVELAKTFGMDNIAMNWENLKKFATQLDEEEKKMQKELEDLQNKLNLVRMTRELLRRIGI